MAKSRDVPGLRCSAQTGTACVVITQDKRGEFSIVVTGDRVPKRIGMAMVEVFKAWSEQQDGIRVQQPATGEEE